MSHHEPACRQAGKSRFLETQFFTAIKAHEAGRTVEDTYRELGVSTFA
jgi:hypothetical protein